MRRSVWALSVVMLLVSGCGHAAVPSASGSAMGAIAAAAAKKGTGAGTASPEVRNALSGFSKQEGRKVDARQIEMNEGRGAAELYVSLNTEDRLLLRQLYRLNPRPLEAAKFPEGLLERSKAHLATLYRFKFPQGAPLEPTRLASEVRTRQYVDSFGDPLAYETWLVGDNFQLFGKYDLKGRLLKIDIETWE